MKLIINLKSLLYNNDKKFIDSIKNEIDTELFDEINDNFMNKKMKEKNVNKFKLDINDDDMIDSILKKLNILLFNKLKYKVNESELTKHTCSYCFSDNDKNKVIKLDKKKSKKKVKRDDYEELEDDLKDIFSDEEDFLEEDEEEDMEFYFDMYGGKKENKNKYSKIFMCYNCMKVYGFNDYFKPDNIDKYNDIYPYTDLFYLFNKDYTIPNSYIEHKYEINPLTNILDIDNSKEKIEIFNDNVVNSTFDIIKNDLNELDLIYFPELMLYYKNNKYKGIELYSKYYYPQINIQKYYTYFYHDKYFTSKKLELDNLNILEEDFKVINKYFSWLNEFESSIINLENFNDIKYKENKNNLYISKIFYDMFDEKNKGLDIINFNKIYHLFDMTDEVPYMVMYNSELSKVIEKIKYDKKKILEKYKWNIGNTNIIQFKILLPKWIKKIDGEEQNDDYYIHINLFKDMKINVTISLPINSNIFIDKKDLYKLNNYINKNLIEKLNKLNILNYNYRHYSFEKFDTKENKNNNFKINSINFFIDINLETEVKDLYLQVYKLQKCLSQLFILDSVDNKLDIRYIRIKNVEIGNLLDKFIFNLYNEYINSYNKDNINKNIIKKLMEKFNITSGISSLILNNYIKNYNNFTINPLGFGIYFNITKPITYSENKLKFSCLGVRNYKDLYKMNDFMNKMYKLVNNIINNDKTDKNINKIMKNCNLDKVEKTILFNNDKIVMVQMEKFKCKLMLNNKKYKKEHKLINKRYKSLDKEYKKLHKKMKNMKNISVKKYITRLKESFDSLKEDDCSMYSKQCQKSRQPIGTGNGYVPEFIEFDEEYEKNRFKFINDITCNYKGQTGGARKKIEKEEDEDENFENIYSHWNSNIYKDLNKCELITDSYTKSELIKIAKQLGIKNTNKLLRKTLCKYIKYYIDNNLKKYLYKKIKENDETKYKLFYYFYFTKFINVVPQLLKTTNITTYAKDLKLKNASRINKKDFSKKLYELSFTKNINDDEIIKKLSKFIDLEIGHLDYKDNKELIKSRIQYDIYNILNELNYKFDLKIMDKYLNKIHFKGEKLENKMNYFRKNNLYIDYRKFEELESYDENYIENIINEYLDFNKIAKKINMLINYDEDNDLIQTTLKYKNRAISCPNFEDKGIDNNLVGFLDIHVNDVPENMDENEIRNKMCKPCCFKSNKSKNNEILINKSYVRNALFCNNQISWDQYKESYNNAQRLENYISSFANKNNIYGTYGKLPDHLHNLFNNYVSLYNYVNDKTEKDNILFGYWKNNLLKSPGFVLRGVKSRDNSFIESLEFLLDMKKDDILDEIYEKITSEKVIFYTLNQGKVFSKYKNQDNFINILETKELNNPELFIDILTREDTFSKYPNGIMIYIFTETDDGEVKLIPYESINNKYIEYDANDKITTLFLYKYKNNSYEPIILYDKKIQKRFDYKLNKYNYDFAEFINNWYVTSFTPNYLTIEDVIYEFGENIIEKQIVDEFKKVLFLILKGNVLVPMVPHGYNEYINDESMDNIDKYLYTLDKTVENMKKWSKIINDKNYNVNKVIVLDNIITSVELINGLIIPIKHQKYTKNIKFKKSNNIEQFKINKILFNNIDLKYPSLKKILEKYDDELYINFKLNFSTSLTEIEKNKLIKIVDMYNENKKDKLNVINSEKYIDKIKKIINDKWDNIVNTKEENLEKYIINKSNIRKNCNIINTKGKCNSTPFCSYEDNKCKINIPINKKEIFVNILASELINNNQEFNNILNQFIDIIIDKNNYKNDNNNVFNFKDF